MALFLLVVRIALAAVFVVAAGGKLLDRDGARQAMRDFGLPGSLAPRAALLLPIVELAVAVALVPPASGWFGDIGALLLLAAFSTAIAANLAQGRAPDCHCFGQIGGGPVGLTTLARNAGLGALAVIPLAAGPDQDGYGWIGDMTALEQTTLALGVLATILAVTLLALVAILLARLRSYRERIATLEADLPPPGLPVGDPAPTFALPPASALSLGTPSSNGATPTAGDPTAGDAAAGAAGAATRKAPTAPVTPEALTAPTTLEALTAPGVPVLLTFTAPTCPSCQELYPDLAQWQRDHAHALTVAVIATGDPEANRRHAAKHGLANLLVQRDLEVSTSYRSDGTPAAVLVTADGTIASPLARGPEEIRALTSPLRALPAPSGPS